MNSTLIPTQGHKFVSDWGQMWENGQKQSRKCTQRCRNHLRNGQPVHIHRLQIAFPPSSIHFSSFYLIFCWYRADISMNSILKTWCLEDIRLSWTELAGNSQHSMDTQWPPHGTSVRHHIPARALPQVQASHLNIWGWRRSLDKDLEFQDETEWL